MLVKTKGVILREIKFRDQSKICPVFTEHFGKISVLLKGVRNPKNKLSGLFSTGNMVELVLYKKQNRDLHLVSDALLLQSPMSAEPDMERFTTLYQLIETLKLVTGSDEPQPALFGFLSTTLEEMCKPDRDFQLLLAWFLIRLVAVLGFEPELEQCVISGEPLFPAAETMPPDQELSFVFDPGGVAFAAPAATQRAEQRPIPALSFRLLRWLSRQNIDALQGIDIPAEHPRRLCDLLQDYCAMHIDHLPSVRNRRVISQIRPGNA